MAGVKWSVNGNIGFVTGHSNNGDPNGDLRTIPGTKRVLAHVPQLSRLHLEAVPSTDFQCYSGDGFLRSRSSQLNTYSLLCFSCLGLFRSQGIYLGSSQQRRELGSYPYVP